METKRTQKPHFDIGQYVGKRVHSLTVVGLAERKPSDREWKLHCVCDCGKTTDITPSQFNRGVVKSCGCLRNTRCGVGKGHSKHPLYHVWLQMIYRCELPSSPIYSRYGGRGIRVCKEWHDFGEFAKWAEHEYTSGLTIDRKDNNGDYCPENCRWITQTEQCRNKSDNVVIEYNGKRQTLSEWAKELGMTYMCISHRYNRGWTVERMLTEPVNHK